MAGTWWSKRFVDVLESYGLGTRMGRGRRYARSGQVISLDVRAGLLVAQVQGSRQKPYVVTIRAATPSATQWRGIDAAMRSRVGFAAQLLAGEVPAELEAVFGAARTQLLPSNGNNSTLTATARTGRTPASTSPPCSTCSPTTSTTTPGSCSRGGAAAASSSSNRYARVPATTWARADTGPVVAPWWPFGPLETLPVKTAAVVRSRDDEDHDVVVDPADPPTAVLRRCEALDVAVRDTEVSVLLTAAYEALASREL